MIRVFETSTIPAFAAWLCRMHPKAERCFKFIIICTLAGGCMRRRLWSGLQGKGQKVWAGVLLQVHPQRAADPRGV